MEGAQGFLKCYKLGQPLEPSWIWKTMENVIMWALKKSGKTSFIIQWQIQRAYQQLQTQELYKQSGRDYVIHAASANTKPDTYAHKPAQLHLIVAIFCFAGNDNIVIDMVWVILFQVRHLIALWLLIVRSDNAILATN